jgi:hypothetical protein
MVAVAVREYHAADWMRSDLLDFSEHPMGRFRVDLRVDHQDFIRSNEKEGVADPASHLIEIAAHVFDRRRVGRRTAAKRLAGLLAP